MAGAGYRLFNTGDVLTAAQVNTFLMEQTVMVFNDAASRTTALSGVVAEGMLSYLKSTKQVEVYNGSVWVASDDPNAIQNTIVDAKGDLIAATANDTPARLAVGSDGSTLVADSSASTGLRWQGNFAAGKNLIINSDFNIWQRGTSFANPNFSDYLCDRFRMVNYDTKPTSATISRQTFTPGSAPVAGYESQYFFRSTITTVGTTTQYDFGQFIEDLRAVAGRIITVSFWAKSDSTRTQTLFAGYNNITGGTQPTISNPTFTTTTSWQRFSFTFSAGSLSGATINANTSFYIFIRQACASGSVFDWWGVQVEIGNTATAFQTATGTLAGELAACQRYYRRKTSVTAGANAYMPFATGRVESTSNAYVMDFFPVPMRTTPSFSGSGSFALYTVGATTGVTLVGDQSSVDGATITVIGSGMTAGRAAILQANNNNTCFIEWSAEL